MYTRLMEKQKRICSHSQSDDSNGKTGLKVSERRPHSVIHVFKGRFSDAL